MRPPAGGGRVLWPLARFALNLILVAVAAGVTIFVMVRLRLVIVPLLVSVLLATLLIPAADFLRARRIPSALATLLVMLASLALLAGTVTLVAPQVVDQFDELGESAQQGLDEALGWLAQGPLDIERAEIEDALDQAMERLREQSGPLARGLLSGAALVGELVAGLLLVVVLVFFLVHDGRGIWSWAVRQTPERHRDVVAAAGARVWMALSGYVRGVVVIAVVDALLIGLALVIIGVPLVVPLMVLTFFGAFLPLVGAVLAGAVAALVALVTGGVLDAVLVVAAITAIQQVEGDVLYPVIVGRAIDLHPVAILLALTAGTILAGIIGALLAVPVAAAMWVAIAEVREHKAPRSSPAARPPEAGEAAAEPVR